VDARARAHRSLSWFGREEISRLDRWRVPAPRGCCWSCSLHLLCRGERGLSRWDRGRSPGPRGCGWSCSSPPGPQPSGSIMAPVAARIVVLVFIVNSRVSAARVDAGARPRADGGRGRHRRLRVSSCRRGRSRSRHRPGSWWSSSSLPPGNRAQPSGSMCEPEPARTVVVVVIPASAVRVDGDPAAVRVDAGPGAGAELCRGVHRATSAVGVDAATVSGAHVRRCVHRCLREGAFSRSRCGRGSGASAVRVDGDSAVVRVVTGTGADGRRSVHRALSRSGR